MLKYQNEIYVIKTNRGNDDENCNHDSVKLLKIQVLPLANVIITVIFAIRIVMAIPLALANAIRTENLFNSKTPKTKPIPKRKRSHFCIDANYTSNTNGANNVQTTHKNLTHVTFIGHVRAASWPEKPKPPESMLENASSHQQILCVGHTTSAIKSEEDLPRPPGFRVCRG